MSGSKVVAACSFCASRLTAGLLMPLGPDARAPDSFPMEAGKSPCRAKRRCQGELEPNQLRAQRKICGLSLTILSNLMIYSYNFYNFLTTTERSQTDVGEFRTMSD